MEQTGGRPLRKHSAFGDSFEISQTGPHNRFGNCPLRSKTGVLLIVPIGEVDTSGWITRILTVIF